MSTNLNYKQVANVSRRTWDVAAYEKRALERANASAHGNNNGNSTCSNRDEKRKLPQGVVRGTATATATEATNEHIESHDGSSQQQQEEFIPAADGAIGPQSSKRAFLKARTNRIESLDAKIGSVEIVNPEAAATTRSKEIDGGGLVDIGSAVTKAGIGWHCKVCDCFLKDSLAYLDHINGRKHQRNLGYSMRVERSTKDQVVSRLEALVKAKERTPKNAALDHLREEEKDFDELVKARDEELRRKKEERKRERKERKRRKKDQQQNARTDTLDHQSDQSEKQKQLVASASTEQTDDGIDPNIAAMMGFSGFGGGNKNR